MSDSTNTMQQISKSVEKYTKNAIITTLQEVSKDYNLPMKDLYDKYVEPFQHAQDRRCIMVMKKTNRRCSHSVVMGTNYCKRHSHLSLPPSDLSSLPERSCPFKHNHPPYMKNVAGCPKCEFDSHYQEPV